MSVYSGFTTRKQETYYNQLLIKLMERLVALSWKYINNSLKQTNAKNKLNNTIDSHVSWPENLTNNDRKSWTSIYKAFKSLSLMDKIKHLEPKFSNPLKPLVKLIQRHKHELLFDQASSKEDSYILCCSSNSNDELRLNSSRNDISKLDLVATLSQVDPCERREVANFPSTNSKRQFTNSITKNSILEKQRVIYK